MRAKIKKRNNSKQGRLNMEKIKILLVDDEKEFVETLSERIRMRDHDSDVALDGEK